MKIGDPLSGNAPVEVCDECFAATMDMVELDSEGLCPVCQKDDCRIVAAADADD